MADWTELDTNGLLPGEPFTSAKALAFFENPVAMGEGAVNAPKVVSEALNMFARVGSGTTDYTDLGRINNVLITATITAGNDPNGFSSRTFGYRFSSDNGVTWGSTTSVITVVQAAGTLPVSRTVFVLASLGANNAIQLIESGSRAGVIEHSILGVSGVSP